MEALLDARERAVREEGAREMEDVRCELRKLRVQARADRQTDRHTREREGERVCV